MKQFNNFREFLVCYIDDYIVENSVEFGAASRKMEGAIIRYNHGKYTIDIATAWRDYQRVLHAK